MAGSASPATGRTRGVARVCKVWGLPRSGFHLVRRLAQDPPPVRPMGRRGPKPAPPDAVLPDTILAGSPWSGEGKRKVRAWRCASSSAISAAMPPGASACATTASGSPGLGWGQRLPRRRFPAPDPGRGHHPELRLRRRASHERGRRAVLPHSQGADRPRPRLQDHRGRPQGGSRRLRPLHRRMAAREERLPQPPRPGSPARPCRHARARAAYPCVQGTGCGSIPQRPAPDRTRSRRVGHSLAPASGQARKRGPARRGLTSASCATG